MDVNSVNRADWERRRKIRLAQVRDQSKTIAKTIRDRVHSAGEIQFEQHETTRNKAENKFKSLALSKLKSDFNYLIQDVGNGYSVASVQPDPSIMLAEKRLINRCKAISRGAEAEKRKKQLQEEQQMDKEMRERKTHFNKTVEKIRSTLIQSIPNIDSNNHTPSISKLNECFLIPSQVTLNESNIINWNCNKKTSKPWAMVINSKANQKSKLLQTMTCDDNKENEPIVSKFTNLETDIKSYETLVTELNKLSAEEQNIRNKLFTHNWKEVNTPYKNNVPSSSQETDELLGMDRVKNILDKSAMLHDIKTRITEKKLNESTSSLNTCMSSSSSTSIKYEEPKESIKKTVSYQNKVNEKNTVQSSCNLNYNSKCTTEKPLRNINNTLQRIKKKKELLVKEISANMKPNIKKSNVLSLNSKTLHNTCTASSNLRKESPTSYAKLPNSFYNNTLEGLEQITNKKSINLKCNSSTNVNLMGYINLLLKMTPSDIENLSTSSSSCSSVKLEESILEHSKINTQFFSEMLNCISKCLNADIPDISQDSMFVNSPKNINLLNKLQELSNYYLEKTCKIKNICDEDPQILNEPNIEVDTIIQENNSISISSDSSVDEEYVLKHLNTLLLKKGLIKPDKEWPIFENISDDDTRSLTDQLLDVYPLRSYDRGKGVSCKCQKQFIQQYVGNKKNEAQLQRPLENINEMLKWIKKKKRQLFDEIYTNQAHCDIHSINNKSDTCRNSPNDNTNNYVGLPDSFYNSTLKVLEEYVRNKKQKKSKSNNNNTWINMELMKYICSLLKMSPNEIDNLSVSSNLSTRLEKSILEISKANLEYHRDILNYISKCLDSNMYNINQDTALSSPQYIGLLDKLYKLADYYAEKAHEMRNICLESPKIEINNLNVDAVEQISEKKPGDRKASCSVSSELSVDGAYVLDHLSSLLEQRGLICTDGEWPIFGNDDEEDSRSLTDQLLDIKPQIKTEDIKVECSEIGGVIPSTTILCNMFLPVSYMNNCTQLVNKECNTIV